MALAIAIIQILFIPLASPLVTGVIRKMKAIQQNRKGASIFQPYRNIIKLLRKDEVVSHDASWVSLAFPYIIFAITLVAAVLVPVLGLSNPIQLSGDLIVLVSLLALATFCIASLGLDAGNAFGGLGSSREMTLAALAEAGFFFSLFPVALLVESTNLSLMFTRGASLGMEHFAVLALSLIAFFIVLLSENARYPFDNPSTHLELTMVHEAMIIESSGKRLGLLEWASSNKLLIFMVVGANIFIPWSVEVTNATTLLQMLGILAVKVFVLATIVGVIESATAKLRFFRLPDLLFTALVLGVIATVAAIF